MSDMLRVMSIMHLHARSYYGAAGLTMKTMLGDLYVYFCCSDRFLTASNPVFCDQGASSLPCGGEIPGLVRHHKYTMFTYLFLHYLSYKLVMFFVMFYVCWGGWGGIGSAPLGINLTTPSHRLAHVFQTNVGVCYCKFYFTRFRLVDGTHCPFC